MKDELLVVGAVAVFTLILLVLPLPKGYAAQLTNTSVSTNSTSSSVAIGQLGETDSRQPYSDGHLYSTPNSFGGYTTVVEPNVRVLASGVEMRDGQLFIDGYSSGSCDQKQRAGLPKCW